jgi:NAD+ kinase
MKTPVAIVVAKRTSWRRFVEEAEDPHVLHLLRRNDPTVARMRAAHEAHEATIEAVDRALAASAYEVRRVEDPRQPFATDGADLILTIGGDGTLLTASHHDRALPILGVNSAPGHSVGFFCGAEATTIDEALRRFSDGALGGVTLARMGVDKNGESLSRRVLNDALFCHSSPAATSRYIVELGDHVEEQKSSGFWIGPPAGSTAAQRSAGGDVMPLDAETIQLVVREPYLQGARDGKPAPSILRQVLSSTETLTVRSKMPEAFLFLDGPGERYAIALGDVLRFHVSGEPLRLLGIDQHRARC